MVLITGKNTLKKLCSLAYLQNSAVRAPRRRTDALIEAA